MKETEVVMCFLRFKDKILILRRSKEFLSYEERWGTIIGFPEEGESLEERAIKEIEAQTKMHKRDFELIKDADTFLVMEKNEKWFIHPFLFNVKTKKLKISKEWEFKWINPEDAGKFYTIPGFDEALKKLGII
ncbi:MAG: NUDIX domain-containing protein [Candidatus Aenigmarchaeota archaeon]|nr:NUDIX domain-containing protein [Candidatus Aenigmarchaeota archaeon]